MHNEYIGKNGQAYKSKYPDEYDLDSDDVRRKKEFDEIYRAP